MTFAVSAFCPYPFIPSLPGNQHLPTAVGFIADTRYSWQPPTTAPFDYGAKIALLGRYAGCVCAGALSQAKEAIALAQSFFAEHERSDPQFTYSTLSDRYVHLQQTILARGEEIDFVIAIGCITPAGIPGRLLFGRADQMENHLSWGHIIGQRQLQPLYEQAMHELVESRKRSIGGSFKLDPDWWLMMYAIAFQATLLAEPKHHSVGGGLQLGLVDPVHGMRIHHLFRWEPGMVRAHPLTRKVSFDWTKIPKQFVWDD